jgi:hypothetical protein
MLTYPRPHRRHRPARPRHPRALGLRPRRPRPLRRDRRAGPRQQHRLHHLVRKLPPALPQGARRHGLRPGQPPPRDQTRQRRLPGRDVQRHGLRGDGPHARLPHHLLHHGIRGLAPRSVDGAACTATGRGDRGAPQPRRAGPPPDPRWPAAAPSSRSTARRKKPPDPLHLSKNTHRTPAHRGAPKRPITRPARNPPIAGWTHPSPPRPPPPSAPAPAPAPVPCPVPPPIGRNC